MVNKSRGRSTWLIKNPLFFPCDRSDSLRLPCTCLASPVLHPLGKCRFFPPLQAAPPVSPPVLANCFLQDCQMGVLTPSVSPGAAQRRRFSGASATMKDLRTEEHQVVVSPSELVGHSSCPSPSPHPCELILPFKRGGGCLTKKMPPHTQGLSFHSNLGTNVCGMSPVETTKLPEGQS